LWRIQPGLGREGRECFGGWGRCPLCGQLYHNIQDVYLKGVVVLTMHMCYEHLCHFVYLEVVLAIRLELELTKGSLSTVNHCSGGYETRHCVRYWSVLQREPSLRTSATRLEQLRDCEGPPPLDVPRKVMDIARDMSKSERK